MIVLNWLHWREQQIRGSSEKLSRSYFFISDILFIRAISICKGVLLSVPRREGQLNLETLSSGEGVWLKSHNNFTLVYCALTKICKTTYPCLLCFSRWPPLTGLPTLPPPLQTPSFLFNWRWYLAIWGVTQFSWLSPMYKDGTLYYIIKLLFFLLLYYLLQGEYQSKP